MHDRIRRPTLSRLRRALAVPVAAGLVLASPAGPVAAGSQKTLDSAALGAIVAVAGERLYTADLRPLRELPALVAGATGSCAVTMHVAELAPAMSKVTDSTDELRLVGEDAATVVRARTGHDLDLVRGWEPRLRWTIEAGPTHVVSTHVVGADTMSVRISRAVLEEPAGGGPIEVTVNGETASVLPGDPLTTGLGGDSIPRFEGRLADTAAFVAATEAFSRLLHETIGGEGPWVLPADARCIPPCLSCATALAGVGVSLLGVMVACGGTTATAGAALPACLAALIGHNITQLSTFSACAGCYLCENPTEPNPNPEPGPGGEDGDSCTPCDWGSSAACPGVPPPWCNDDGLP